jgi:hypothetical protein
MTTNHLSPIETLRAEFEGVKLMSVENAKRLTAILNQASDCFIVELIHAKIKFVSKLAVNHASRRGLLS